MIKINEEQYEKISKILPKQRGNIKLNNIDFINALLYICENGYKWRVLPKEYDNWHTIYVRFNRCSKNGVLEKLFLELQVQQQFSLKIKSGKQSIGKSRGDWSTKIHMISIDSCRAYAFSLSTCNSHDAPEGRLLLEIVRKESIILF